MSWLFSRALVEACSPPNSLETEPCAQLNVMPTQHQFWRNDKTMEPSRFSRFGLTFAALTEDRGAELLTAWLAGFLARTSAPQDQAQALTDRAQDSGANSPASFAKWSPELFGWKTAQCSLLEDSPECLAILPRWGSMRNGMLYLRQTLAPGISVTGFGLLLPTLDASQQKYRLSGGTQQSKSLEAMARTGVLSKLPTLVARDYRHPGRSRAERTGSKAGDHLPNSVGGPLNPDWCEWFMGFPIGWTASSALEMPKFHEWQQQHTPRLPSSSKEAA